MYIPYCHKTVSLYSKFRCFESESITSCEMLYTSLLVMYSVISLLVSKIGCISWVDLSGLNVFYNAIEQLPRPQIGLHRLLCGNRAPWLVSHGFLGSLGLLYCNRIASQAVDRPPQATVWQQGPLVGLAWLSEGSGPAVLQQNSFLGRRQASIGYCVAIGPLGGSHMALRGLNVFYNTIEQLPRPQIGLHRLLCGNRAPWLVSHGSLRAMGLLYCNRIASQAVDRPSQATVWQQGHLVQ